MQGFLVAMIEYKLEVGQGTADPLAESLTYYYHLSRIQEL